MNHEPRKMRPRGGYAPLSRTVLGPDVARRPAWFREATPLVRNLWFELLAGVNWRPGVTESGVALQRGEMVTTWRGLARRIAWTERGCRKEPAVALVRRAMEYLRLAGEVDWIGLKCLGADPSAENTETVADQPADPCGWLGLRVRLLRWDLYAIAVANEGHEAAEGSGIASAGEAADTNNSTSMNRTERNSALPPSGNGTGPEDPNEVIRLADAVDVEEAKKRRRAGTATRIDLIALIRADDHDKHERRQQVEDWT